MSNFQKQGELGHALDTYALLERWLNELNEEQMHYKVLFPEKNDIREHFCNKQPGPSILGIPMAEGLIKELLTRLDSMQQVIRLHQNQHQHQHQQTTGMDLLKVVQPQLAEYYERAFKTHPIPEMPQKSFSTAEATQALTARQATQVAQIRKRFEMVTQGLYEVTPQGHRQSTYPTIKAVSQSLRLKTALTEQDVLNIVQGKAMSPRQALATLQQLQTAQLTEIEHALLSEEKSERQNERKSEQKSIEQQGLVRFQTLVVRHQLLIMHHITESMQKRLVLTPHQ